MKSNITVNTIFTETALAGARALTDRKGIVAKITRVALMAFAFSSALLVTCLGGFLGFLLTGSL